MIGPTKKKKEGDIKRGWGGGDGGAKNHARRRVRTLGDLRGCLDSKSKNAYVFIRFSSLLDLLDQVSDTLRHLVPMIRQRLCVRISTGNVRYVLRETCKRSAYG